MYKKDELLLMLDEIDTAVIDAPETDVFDIENVYYNCTVQVLKNSRTGEVSIGYYKPSNTTNIFPRN